MKLKKRNICSITEKNNKVISDSIDAIRGLDVLKRFLENNKYTNNLSSLLASYAFNDDDWTTTWYDSPVDNDKNMAEMSELKAEAHKLYECIDKIVDELGKVVEDERHHLDSIHKKKIVTIKKAMEYPTGQMYIVNVATIDAETNELLSTSGGKSFSWKDRSNITDYLFKLHEKYGVTEYVSDVYEPTKKVKTVYSEYRFA